MAQKSVAEFNGNSDFFSKYLLFILFETKTLGFVWHYYLFKMQTFYRIISAHILNNSLPVTGKSG